MATLTSFLDDYSVASVALSRRNLQNLNQFILIIPPNFLANTIIELQNMEVGLMLLKVNSDISAHDKRHNDDAGFSKSDENCKDYPDYLWAESKGEVSILDILHDPDYVKIIRWGKRRQAEFIIPSENILSASRDLTRAAVVQQIFTNIQNQTDWV